jgi:hypothetical protein
LLRGLCSVCGTRVGGPFKPILWQCPKCRSIFCPDCPKKKAGWLFKKPLCPECNIEMTQEGLKSFGK